MSERKYSLNEIDQMRSALSRILTPDGVSFMRVEKDAEIEGQLRTYMANGTEPSELIERARNRRL